LTRYTRNPFRAPHGSHRLHHGVRGNSVASIGSDAAQEGKGVAFDQRGEEEDDMVRSPQP
jgi:hypothetical protein